MTGWLCKVATPTLTAASLMGGAGVRSQAASKKIKLAGRILKRMVKSQLDDTN
ncbi:hypothetical protein GCM10027361_31950 [Erwinia aphidicola]